MATLDDLNAAIQAAVDAGNTAVVTISQLKQQEPPTVDFQPQVDSLTALAASLQAAVA